jgi:SAM-dependent methyltransferase
VNRQYWNKRFSNEGKIWGETPSKTAFHALKIFKQYGVKSILIPGSGYGRHSKFFTDNNISVKGIEISDVAFEIAKKYNPQAEFINGSVLDMPLDDITYDAIYCFNTLHLFLKNERDRFLQKCFNLLVPRGYVFFVVFSDEESSFGKGTKLEENTFESKPGRYIHYFYEDDLRSHFNDYEILETGIIEDPENHGERGPHTHKLRYISAQKW